MVVGWLARELVTAEFHLRDAERQTEGLLSSLFPSWHGWAFTRGDGGAVAIDVFEAHETPEAVAALHRAGFAIVVIHPHKGSKVITCSCTPREAP